MFTVKIMSKSEYKTLVTITDIANEQLAKDVCRYMINKLYPNKFDDLKIEITELVGKELFEDFERKLIDEE